MNTQPLVIVVIVVIVIIVVIVVLLILICSNTISPIYSYESVIIWLLFPIPKLWLLFPTLFPSLPSSLESIDGLLLLPILLYPG